MSGWPSAPCDPACEPDDAHCSPTAVDGRGDKRLQVQRQSPLPTFKKKANLGTSLWPF